MCWFAGQTECAILQFADEISSRTFGNYREEYPESSAVKVSLMADSAMCQCDDTDDAGCRFIRSRQPRSA